MPFKTFTNGSVLTDTDLNNYLMTQTVITCLSSGRPSTVTTGMTIFETDTLRYATWQSSTSTWEYFAGKRTTYTPVVTATVTSPTLGTGSTAQGWYQHTPGPSVTYYFVVKFGSSGVNAGSGDYRVSMPIGSSTPLGTAVHNATGSLLLADSSTGGFRTGTCFVPGTNLSNLSMIGDGGANIIGAANPWTWAAGDYMSGMITYPVQN